MKALGETLKHHWGAVGRDLSTCGYTWDDVGSARLPIEQFVAFVFHAPPGTALYHEMRQGWTISDHLLADQIDILNLLLWTKSKDAHRENPRHRPERIRRPGIKFEVKKSPEQEQEQARPMTVAEYAEKAGIQMNWGEEA